MATTTTGFQIPLTARAMPAAAFPRSRRRRITPEAGHALELLGHAIEYLTDEFVAANGSLEAHNPQIEAIQLLMARNRRVYFECPEVPTLRERWIAFLHRYLPG